MKTPPCKTCEWCCPCKRWPESPYWFTCRHPDRSEVIYGGIGKNYELPINGCPKKENEK